MLELIVVIGIIALLASISVIVLGSALQSARIKATEATLSKIDQLITERKDSLAIVLQRQELKYINYAKDFAKTAQAIAAAQNNPNYSPFDPLDERSRAWRPVSYAVATRQILPQAFVDICGPDRGPGFQGAVASTNNFPDVSFFLTNGSGGEAHGDYEPIASILKKMGQDGMLQPAKHLPHTESSELLYLALVMAADPSGAETSVPAFTSTEVADTDGDGLLEFIDSWGEPIRFYRYPTRLLRCAESASTGDFNADGDSNTPAGWPAAPNPTYAGMVMRLPANGGQILKRDPADPESAIYLSIVKDRSNPANEWNKSRRFEQWFYTPDTYHSYLLVSAGPDRKLGFYESSIVPSVFPATNTSVMGHLAEPTPEALVDPSASPIVDNVTRLK